MSEISEQCQHRWPDIFLSLGVDEKVINKRNQPCPLCGGKDRFRYIDNLGDGRVVCNQCAPDTIDGFEFLMRLTGKSFADIARDIRDVIGKTVARAPQNADLEKIRMKLKRTWLESKPLSRNCPTHLYLCNRGLSGLTFSSLKGIRCHPGIDYWYSEGSEKPEKLGTFSAMVGAVTTPDGLPATLHITYLNKDGSKAALDPVRKIMTPSRQWSGGAVRLEPLQPNQILCVAEGIETALAMKLMYPDVCPWAVISEGNMQKFEPPELPEFANCQSIYIGADNDANFVGQSAAYALAKRLTAKKHKAVVLLPKQKGTDFLDELNTQETAA